MGQTLFYSMLYRSVMPYAFQTLQEWQTLRHQQDAEFNESLLADQEIVVYFHAGLSLRKPFVFN